MSPSTFHVNFHPQFVERYQKILPDSWQDFLESYERRPSKALRVNTLKMSIKAFQNLASQKGWQLSPVPWCPEGFLIDRSNITTPLGSTPEHQAGLFYIQEAASMLPVAICADLPGNIALDMCAAPGSKTSHLAQVFENDRAIIACEPSKKRVHKIADNVVRLGIHNVHILNKDSLAFASRFPNTFDLVIADPPCSGEGYMRGKPDLIKKWGLGKIHEAAKLQKQILEAAWEVCKKDGYLVYSTCTLAPEENEEIVYTLLKKYPGSVEIIDIRDKLHLQNADQLSGLTQFEDKEYGPELAKSIRLWPHIANCEGFFVCLMQKKESKARQAKQVKNNFQPQVIHESVRIGKNEFSALQSYLRKKFGYHLSSEDSGVFKKSEHHYILQSELSKTLDQSYRWFKQGLEVIQKIRDQYSLTHAGALLWGAFFEKQVLELDPAQTKRYMQGFNISLEPQHLKHLEEGQILLRSQKIPLGLGLLRNGNIKNQLPRDFVIH